MAGKNNLDNEVTEMRESAIKVIWSPYVLAKYSVYAESRFSDDIFYVLLRGSMAGERGGKLYGLDDNNQVVKHKDVDIVVINKNGANRNKLREEMIMNCPEIPEDILAVDPNFAYECSQGNLYDANDILNDIEKIMELEKKEDLKNGEAKLLEEIRDKSWTGRALNRGVILFPTGTKLDEVKKERDRHKIEDEKALADKDAEKSIRKRFDDYIEYRKGRDKRPITIKEYITGFWADALVHVKDVYRDECMQAWGFVKSRIQVSKEEYARFSDQAGDERNEAALVCLEDEIDLMELISQTFRKLYA